MHAIYAPYLTIIESREKRDGILPIVLVEGLFIQGDTLTLSKYDREGPQVKKEASQGDLWNLTIPEDSQKRNIVRYLPSKDSENLSLYLLKGNKWQKTKSKWDGKYLVFESDQKEISFSVVHEDVDYIKYAWILLTLTLILILLVKHGKNKQKKEAA